MNRRIIHNFSRYLKNNWQSCVVHNWWHRFRHLLLLERRNILATISTYLLLLSIYCYTTPAWKAHLPSIDVVLLLYSQNIVNNTESNTFLIDTYYRHEEEYLGSLNSTTIIISPVVTWDSSKISVGLEELVYSFTSLSVENSNNVFNTRLKVFDSNFLSFASEAQMFVTAYLYPLYASSSVPKANYLMNRVIELTNIISIGRFITLLFSFTLVAALVVLINYGASTKLVLFLSSVFAAKSSMVVMVVGIVNSVLSLVATFHFTGNMVEFFIYLSEIVSCLLLIPIIWHEFKLNHLKLKDRLLMKSFHASPEYTVETTSSIYSLRTKNLDSLEKITLDPLPGLGLFDTDGTKLFRSSSARTGKTRRPETALRCATAPVASHQYSLGDSRSQNYNYSRFNEILD